MKERLPLYLENNELPVDQYQKINNKKHSYGYVSILNLLSTLITLTSLLTIISVWNRR